VLRAPVRSGDAGKCHQNSEGDKHNAPVLVVALATLHGQFTYISAGRCPALCIFSHRVQNFLGLGKDLHDIGHRFVYKYLFCQKSHSRCS
jgi:hypothetical protein